MCTVFIGSLTSYVRMIPGADVTFVNALVGTI